jgi:hypothetical protein
MATSFRLQPCSTCEYRNFDEIDELLALFPQAVFVYAVYIREKLSETRRAAKSIHTKNLDRHLPLP